MTETTGFVRKEQLKEFQRNAHRLLSEDDRNYLHYILKDYQTYKSVEKLISALKSCLDDPRKMDLLADIRNLIPSAHLGKFDSLAPYGSMAHPLKLSGQGKKNRKTQSLPHNYKNSELRSLGRSSSPKTEGSFKVINLIKSVPEESLGFKIRGGRENDSAVYIAEVEKDSSLAKQGLQVGDEIIEVNGIDFEKITKSSAEQLLQSMKKIKLVVKSGGNVPKLEVFESW